MPRKPADSAYILALALRTAWREGENNVRKAQEYNKSVLAMNQGLINQGFTNEQIDAFSFKEIPVDGTVYWGSVVKKIEGVKDISEGLAIVTDADYRAIILDAVKQPFNRVRNSKGFQVLVPELNTLRRYGPYDNTREMDVTEDEARELADLIWAQEMEPFIEAGRGVDPINKQIIANKVSRELKEINVKYLGEEIVSVTFDDAALDAYEYDHKEVLAILSQGIEAAYELFSYDPANTYHENKNWVRQNVLMYNSMFEKDMDDERLDDLVDSIICCFQYFQQLIE